MFRTISLSMALLAAMSLGFAGCSKDKAGSRAGKDDEEKAGKHGGGPGGAVDEAKVASFMALPLGGSVDDAKSIMGSPTFQSGQGDEQVAQWHHGSCLMQVRAKGGKIDLVSVTRGDLTTDADLSAKYDQLKSGMTEAEAMKTMAAPAWILVREKDNCVLQWQDKTTMYHVGCKAGKIETLMRNAKN